MTPRLASLRHPHVAVALCFGVGLSPWAPGTAGAAFAFLMYVPLSTLSLPLRAVVVIGLFVLGCVSCARAASKLGQDDHPAIVWDEAVGMLIVLAAAPDATPAWLAGFLAFRWLDIAKPWPIHLVEARMRGGLAIMFDDAVAAAGALAFVWLIHLLPFRLFAMG